MKQRRALALASLLLAAPLLITSTKPAIAAGTKQATTFGGTPTIGPLFLPIGLGFHICTAGVVRSHNQDVIVTAAHCIRGGTGAGYLFAPGYHDGKAPYGMWRVVAAYGAPAWVHQTNVHDDFAFLRVASRHVNGKTVTLQSVVGGNRLGQSATAGQRITIVSYPLGFGGSPIHCRTTAFVDGRFRGFHCNGYGDGTSGSSWLAGHGSTRTVVGILGGLHQGGCVAGTSYSSPLGRAAHQALRRAGHGRRGDVFPNPPNDGC